MSVATEFPPAVYIPERARSTMPYSRTEPRHLTLVPGREQVADLGSPERQKLPDGRRQRPGVSFVEFGASFIEGTPAWPLVVTPAPAPLRLTRRGVIAAVLATIVLGFGLLFLAYVSAGSSHAGAPSLAAGATVTVRPGDTLWSIAEQVQPNHDPRLVVDQLRALNRLDPGSLTPGQTLKVN